MSDGTKPVFGGEENQIKEVKELLTSFYAEAHTLDSSYEVNGARWTWKLKSAENLLAAPLEIQASKISI